MMKIEVEDLAILGGPKLFEIPKSTSNLTQPRFEQFLEYSREFYNQRQYTNQGPLVQLLEKRLADFHQVEFCVTFCSGFWALVLAISSLKIEGRDEIIMPSLTYRRMADIAAWAGLKPHFCEVEKDTLSPSADSVRKCVSEHTSLILGVHPIVNLADIPGLINISEETGIPLLFDSVESTYESSRFGKIGGFGRAECFSLHASKLVNGFEGGYVTTNDKQLSHRLSALRNFGYTGASGYPIAGGMNAKLNEIHAAMALANLDKIHDQVEHNQQIYRAYRELLQSISGLRLVEFNETGQTSYKNILVEITKDWPLPRDDTVKIINSENILARSYYSPPLHRKNIQYEYIPATLELTDFLSERFILLPCGEHVVENDIVKIAGLFDFISKHGSTIYSSLVRASGGK